MGVNRLLSEEGSHFPRWLARLESDEQLSTYVYKILDGEPVKFSPMVNRRQSQLESIGIIKSDAEGNCKIRNRVYESLVTVKRVKNQITEDLKIRGQVSQIDFPMIPDSQRPASAASYSDEPSLPVSIIDNGVR